MKIAALKQYATIIRNVTVVTSLQNIESIN